MGDRYKRIEDAFASTFNWMFNRKRSVIDDPEIEGLAGENWEFIMRRGINFATAKEETITAAAGEDITPVDVKKKESSPRWSSLISWLEVKEDVY
jgi:hypothetical protein